MKEWQTLQQELHTIESPDLKAAYAYCVLRAIVITDYAAS